MEFKTTQGVILPKELVKEARAHLEKVFSQFAVKVELDEEPIEMTKVNVTFKLDTAKAIKAFVKNMTQAQDEDVSKLAKVKSFVEKLQKDFLRNILATLQRG